MVGFIDGVLFNATSGGTGTFTVSSAVTGYLTPAQANAVNAQTYYYRAQNLSLTQWEIGLGTYTVSGTTLSRGQVLFSSNSNSQVNFTSPPLVAIVRTGEAAGDVDPTAASFFGLSIYQGQNTGLATTAALMPGQALLGLGFANNVYDALWVFQGTSGAAATFFNSLNAGGTMVVCISPTNTAATVSSVTDSAGNVYTRAVRSTPTAGVQGAEIWYSSNIANAISGGSTTLTVTVSAGTVSFDAYGCDRFDLGLQLTPGSTVQTSSLSNISVTSAGTMPNVGVAFACFGQNVDGNIDDSYPFQTYPGYSNTELNATPSYFGYLIYNWSNPTIQIDFNSSTADTAGCIAAFGISNVNLEFPLPVSLGGDVSIDATGAVTTYPAGQNTVDSNTGLTVVSRSTGMFESYLEPVLACVLDANYTLTSTTGAQQIFNASANGAVFLSAGIYFFDGLLYVTSMSATSGNAQINILGGGSATIDSMQWMLTGVDSSTPTNVTTTGYSFVINTGASPASGTTAETGTQWAVTFKGVVRVSGDGTLQPTIALVNAASAVVNKNSYIRFEPVGALGDSSLATFGLSGRSNAWS